jgi:hypothetical protein
VVTAEAAFVVGIGTVLGVVPALTALMGVVSGLRDCIPDTPTRRGRDAHAIGVNGVGVAFT